ncbi:hypothetical protein NP493_1324g00007 [Ridgeia piscesae]|uniref:Uncharacterized protein n=1 Tax=Ridgeia piscesae TaxID=27915 RepID=A0AAD9K9A4_RIDPI|nr:hypothetical protein NP493_1324g00007 [Ridgeia piscesae]
MFSVSSAVNVSVASRVGVLAPRSTLFLSHADLGSAKAESGQIADWWKMQHPLLQNPPVRASGAVSYTTIAAVVASAVNAVIFVALLIRWVRRRRHQRPRDTDSISVESSISSLN